MSSGYSKRLCERRSLSLLATTGPTGQSLSRYYATHGKPSGAPRHALVFTTGVEGLACQIGHLAWQGQVLSPNGWQKKGCRCVLGAGSPGHVPTGAPRFLLPAAPSRAAGTWCR